MTSSSPPRLDGHLSFKGNLKTTRYGWLRLTPAYSVHLVNEVLKTADLPPGARVLDPFCGTGTTALVCAQNGWACDSTDINPFLVWLAQAKTEVYDAEEIARFQNLSHGACDALLDTKKPAPWFPPLHQIEKWWESDILNALGRLAFFLRENGVAGEKTLSQIAFCRLLIEASNASFGHQSMSFKKKTDEAASLTLFSSFDTSRHLETLAARWNRAVCDIAHSATSPIHVAPHLHLCDARNLASHFAPATFDCVLTSPPYPNRMSYIRELRPYMYWLGYLQTGRDAGELDWKAIGGTWGCATSNLNAWQPDELRPIPFKDFLPILQAIGKTSPLLARYVHKYFEDICKHVESLWPLVKSGATLHYIVGNSKFYDVMLPVEQIYAAIFKVQGFENVEIRTVRKRTSKKELWEFLVSARRP